MPRRGVCHAGSLEDNARRGEWTIATEAADDIHPARFPRQIPELCISAASGPGDLVLDPFAGSGTTLAVARGLGRDFVGIELNPEYGRIIEARLGTGTAA